MAERTGILTRTRERTFPGAVLLGPKDPPLEGLPSHRANVVIIRAADPTVSDTVVRKDPQPYLLPFFNTSIIKPFQTTPDQTAQPEREKITPLEAKIRKNFYRSFEFSQESRDLQAVLLTALNPQYNSEEFRSEFGSLDELDRRMAPRIAKLQIPAGHKEIPNPKNEFEKMWAVQLEIFRSHFEDDYQPAPDSLAGQFLQKTEAAQRIAILSGMISRDYDKISQKVKDENFDDQYGRPESNVGRDVFGSQVKKYLIDGDHTGSSEYDVLFKSLRVVATKALLYDPARDTGKFDLAFSTLSVKMKDLGKLWEEKHQGEKFSTIERPRPIFYSEDTDEGSVELWQEFYGVPVTEGEIFPDS